MKGEVVRYIFERKPSKTIKTKFGLIWSNLTNKKKIAKNKYFIEKCRILC